MQTFKKKLGALVASAATAVILVLLVVLSPMMQNHHTGEIGYSVLLIGLSVAACAACFVLTRLYTPSEKKLRGKPAIAINIAMILCGCVFVVCNCYDAILWAFFHQIPAPNSIIINPVDRVLLILSLAFGVLAGVYFVYIGMSGVADSAVTYGTKRVWGLAPTVWIWLRLARYELSYASSTNIKERFFQLMMLVFAMLFLFTFARYISRVGQKPTSTLAFFAMAAGIFCIVCPLARTAFYLLNQTACYDAYNIVGPVDFAIGVLALTFAWSSCSRAALTAPEDEVATEPAPEEPSGDSKQDEFDVSAVETEDDILNEIQQKKE